MGSSHVAVGVGSASAMDALTTLLTGFNGWDGAHASAAAFLITAGAAGAYASAVAFIRWKYPTAVPATAPLIIQP
jgi:hypothetical protein